MGKWVCPCGQSMNDHAYPDKNFYRVFSDEDWDRIETDKNGNMNFFEDIPIPTYDVYKCPSCGRLMVFGDDDTYKIYIPEEK